MKIIISPAKKMNIEVESLAYHKLPMYLDDTSQLLDELKSMSYEELKNLWKCNDKIVEQNLRRIQNMDLRNHLIPAILSYEGIQYQYMAPTVFEEKMLEYIQKHLRILSGFYGVLRPMDGVTPYRLEMQAKLDMYHDTNEEADSSDVTRKKPKDLYDYWGRKIYDGVVTTGIVIDSIQGKNVKLIGCDNKKANIIINLASKEYSKCVEKYLQEEDVYITCVFGELVSGKVVQKGTYAKMARGEMVRYMAENQIEEPERIKGFNRLGYRYDEGYSSENNYVFIK